ncbi:MAG TPA: SDR family oxidoreductase [Caulobacterales bacterium]|nr:SDR family oxidoreductase [Caulobacterales bacterium]
MLQGKIAIVVGGNSGIGAATSRLLASQGARVLIASERPVVEMASLCAEIEKAGGAAEAMHCNIAERGDITRLFGHVKDAYGRLDILVNCAGVFARAPLTEMPEDKIDAIFTINLVGAVQLIRAALPLMRESGGGAIVSIASAAAVLGVEGCAAYAASKAALVHFTRTLAPELRRTGIRVNCIGPGPVRTPMLGFTEAPLTAEQQQSMIKREAGSTSPYGNAMMEPDDIAQIALFLVSDAARGMQGAFVVADQGISAAMSAPG